MYAVKLELGCGDNQAKNDSDFGEYFFLWLELPSFESLSLIT